MHRWPRSSSRSTVYADQQVARSVEAVSITSPFVAAFAVPLEMDLASDEDEDVAQESDSWAPFGGYVLFTALLNALLLVLMIWLFRTRWRVADVTRTWISRPGRRIIGPERLHGGFEHAVQHRRVVLGDFQPVPGVHGIVVGVHNLLSGHVVLDGQPDLRAVRHLPHQHDVHAAKAGDRPRSLERILHEHGLGQRGTQILALASSPSRSSTTTMACGSVGSPVCGSSVRSGPACRVLQPVVAATVRIAKIDKNSAPHSN